jgi:endonuclease/exonuclease/phosphatase family metal-dependent hydrolase
MRQSRARSPYPRRVLLLIMAVVAALVPAGTASGAVGGPALTVMTRNLYLGTGLDNTVTATTPGALVAAATQDWLNVVANDFPTRARALAEEIVQAQPDVLALQEVSLWRDQTPSDLVTGNTTANAGHVVYDFLAILRAELATREAPYVVEATSFNADAEAPRMDPASSNGLTDVRLTDRDALLVRAPLAAKFTDPHNGRYAAQFTVPSFRGPVSFTRGWTSMDYRHDARTTVRIFETHLEVESPPTAAHVQVAQGNEALAIIGGSPFPVVVLGDFNSAADGSTTPTYANLTAALADAWATARPHDPGVTCCQNELLDSVQPFAARIDMVLTTWLSPIAQVARVGTTPFRLRPPPIWASDHAGVTARLELQH